MKETKKTTRVLCIAILLCNLAYVIIKIIRTSFYTNMMNHNAIYETTLTKIVHLDYVTTFLQILFSLLIFFTLLYLLQELIHGLLKKDCGIVLGSISLCLLTILISVPLFDLPYTSFEEELWNLFPYFLISCIGIAFINRIKERLYLISLSSKQVGK